MDQGPSGRGPPPDGPGAGGPRGDGPGRDGPDHLERRLSLRDADGKLVAGEDYRGNDAAQRVLTSNGKPVGTLVLAPAGVQNSAADRAFLRRHLLFVVAVGLAGLVLALLLSWWLTRRWLAPIERLARGAQQVAQGKLSARVDVERGDELGQLATQFNDMAQRLEEMDASRREWLADVAHELRTPLAAMRAEVEALQDGIRHFDDKTALRLHRQIMRLIQLVDDLRISLDAPRPDRPLDQVPTHPLALLAEAVTSMTDRFSAARIAIHADAVMAAAQSDRQPTVAGDARQLHQVFLNLLENTLRYTDAGGQWRATYQTVQEGDRRCLRLVLEDSAPGLTVPELNRLFDRLYRGESSRHRDSGGSGLGLAICRNLVQAHGGRIAAAPSPLGGLRITVSLPLLENP